jgi:hypothetical protein
LKLRPVRKCTACVAIFLVARDLETFDFDSICNKCANAFYRFLLSRNNPDPKPRSSPPRGLFPPQFVKSFRYAGPARG